MLCLPIGYVMFHTYKEYPKKSFTDYLKAILKTIGMGIAAVIFIIVLWIHSVS